jgi:polyisoprenoid-binding protein YceI
MREETLVAQPVTLGTEEIVLSAANTSIRFSVRWLGVLTVRGRFECVRGCVWIPQGDLARTSVDVEIDVASLRTGISLRDHHLRGEQFFDVQRHPAITFRGGSLMRWPTHCQLPGSLTARGITRTEELHCSIEESPRADGAPNGHLVLRAVARLRRRAYGIGVPSGIHVANPLFAVIGDEVRVEIAIDVPAATLE